MNILINGKNTETAIINLQQLADEQTHPMFAIALNGEFIAREKYASTFISEQDDIEIVTAMPGG